MGNSGNTLWNKDLQIHSSLFHNWILARSVKLTRDTSFYLTYINNHTILSEVFVEYARIKAVYSLFCTCG